MIAYPSPAGLSQPMSDRRAGARLLGGLSPLLPRIQRAVASGELARKLMRQGGWKPRIVKRRHRFSKDHEYRAQTSETMLGIVARPRVLNRLAPG